MPALKQTAKRFTKGIERKDAAGSLVTTQLFRTGPACGASASPDRPRDTIGMKMEIEFGTWRSSRLVPHSRLILMAGFGGLLLLMIFSALDVIHTLQQIQNENDRIREDFLMRTRVLERIRADLYVSGTYVRDYLMEPESGKAEGHRDSLQEIHQDMDLEIQRYRALLSAPEENPFQVLTDGLASYWSVLEPVFHWDAEQRRKAGAWLRNEVFERRRSMLAIADQIGSLNEAQLNTGREKVQKIFHQSRNRLRLTFGLTIGLGLLLAAFSIQRTLKLEQEAARSYKEVAGARGELKQLSARLVQAQEEERRSIARELHDEIGQSLTGVLVEMANLSTQIRAHDLEAVSAKADEIKGLVEGSIRVVRNMALLLRPPMLDDLGLVPALEWQAREVSRRAGLWVNVMADNVPEILPEEHKTCIYRVVQEALNNIVRHAAARHVTVVVHQEAGSLVLRIEDDGKGFDTRREKGMGLLGIQERVSHLGGAFTVESDPGHGAKLQVVLPLALQEAKEAV
jgi:signal transduction histidine kinase